MGKTKRQLQNKANAAFARACKLERLAGKKQTDSPLFQGGKADIKFEIPLEEQTSSWSLSTSTGEEYKMEGGDSDDDEEHMELECKVKIEVDEDTELVHDPLDLTDMEGLPTATTSGRSAIKVKNARSLEDARRRNSARARIYRARKKNKPVAYLLSNSTRVRDIRPRPENGGGEDGVGQEEPNVCLLCFKEISSAENTSSANSSFPSGKDVDFLVMFVLKKMLEVSNEKLQDYLRRMGNPRKWINFCGCCKVKIREGFAVQQEINELEKRLRILQSEMKDTIVLNFVKNKEKVESFTGRNSDPLRATRETWCHLAKDSQSNQYRDHTKIVEGEMLPSSSSSSSLQRGLPNQHYPDNKNNSAHKGSSTANMDRSHRRKGKLGVRPLSDNTDDVPTFIGDHDDFHSSADTNTTTMTVEEWLFDTKWSANLRFNTKGAFASNGYGCHLCPKLKEMKLEAYVKHILFHNERPYGCSVCDVFLTGSDLELAKLPKLVHKKEGVPADHKCNKEALVPATFQVGNFLECGFCDGETFSSEDERSAHERLVHHETSIPLPYDCSKCSSKFRDYAEWRLHRALEHPELAKLGCFYCDEIFARTTKEGVDLLDPRARKNHIMEHHGPTAKAVKVDGMHCDFCGEIFETGIQLLDHVEADHGLDKNQRVHCSICFARFHSLRSLMVHYRSGIHFDNVSKEKFICDLCGYENSASLGFLEHKLMKHDIQPEDGRHIHSCKEDNCSFKCVVKRTLKVHMMKEHNAERELKCETCGKGFLTRKHLRDHQRIHSGLKPFQCEICGNSFAVKNYLYIHKRLSHQNRPFASTHKKRPSQRRSAIYKKPSPAPTIQGNTHAESTTYAEFNSQTRLQSSPPTSTWTMPPPLPPHQTVLDAGNNYGAN